MVNTNAAVKSLAYLAKQGFNNWDDLGALHVKEDDGLLIFNYTNNAYTNGWNAFELASRGLIISRYGEIVARPFDKFFNWLEGGRNTRAPLKYVMEKLDGSLGILYRKNDKYRIATRGSFNSEQALWATEYYNKHHSHISIPAFTLLFEIIYPDNRIVVDYGEMEELVLLAARNRFTGEYLPRYPDLYYLAIRYGFNLPKEYRFNINSVHDIIDEIHKLDTNHEGFVAEFADGSRFKFKGDRYIELHRAINSITFKKILEVVRKGNFNQYIELLPYEYRQEAKNIRAAIEERFLEVWIQISDAYNNSPRGKGRKEFALWVNENHPQLAPYLFARYDRKDVYSLVYKLAFKDMG